MTRGRSDAIRPGQLSVISGLTAGPPGGAAEGPSCADAAIQPGLSRHPARLMARLAASLNRRIETEVAAMVRSVKFASRSLAQRTPERPAFIDRCRAGACGAEVDPPSSVTRGPI